MKHHLRLAIVFIMALLAGCAVAPSSIVDMPLTAKPPKNVNPLSANGAIFQAAAYRPMFEDRRPRMIGDVLTITISESTSATKESGNSASKTGNATAGVPTLLGISAAVTSNLGVSANNAGKFEEKGASNASNTFTGSITVTVVDVLSNGNLVVSGEKQVAFDKGSEFIRFSGVVSPDRVGAGNVVSSTQVADARIEYRTNSHIDKAEFMSLMTRFFLSVMPL
jgi:flagellar L-ring protein precursor FlgH